jgi:hypothetical protein
MASHVPLVETLEGPLLKVPFESLKVENCRSARLAARVKPRGCEAALPLAPQLSFRAVSLRRELPRTAKP